MKAIGGYPGLELRYRGEYHHAAIKVNSARNAFELCLKAGNIRKVYLPLFTCSAMLEPIKRLGIECDRYPIDYNLEPLSPPSPCDDEVFVYTNYFDLKRETARRLSQCAGSRILIDNAQAFYAMPAAGEDAIYSPRKFFGVSDGGYLYCGRDVELPEITDESYERILPQLKRTDTGAESGYADFRISEESIDNCTPMRMSNLTKAILAASDYEWAGQRRRSNFKILSDGLDDINDLRHLTSDICDECVPLVYPLLVRTPSLRRRLIEEKIFVATYWPNVLQEAAPGTTEHDLASHLIPLPVDQTLDADDMQRIVDTVKKFT